MNSTMKNVIANIGRNDFNTKRSSLFNIEISLNFLCGVFNSGPIPINLDKSGYILINLG